MIRFNTVYGRFLLDPNQVQAVVFASATPRKGMEEWSVAIIIHLLNRVIELTVTKETADWLESQLTQPK